MTSFERLPKTITYQGETYVLLASVDINDNLTVRYENFLIENPNSICVWTVLPNEVPKFPKSVLDKGNAKTFNYCCKGVLETIKKYLKNNPES